MKRKYILPLVFSLVFSGFTKAQVLAVPEIIQEQNQWCWAGVSKCILDYYGYPMSQCDIAEYARTVITWNNFGSVDCCIDPSQGCNYWNYNYGSNGSIQDILIQFGGIQNTGLSYALTMNEVNAETAANHPYVIRWGWFSGGGHFVVGHGVNANDLYYMNPWPGEGYHTSTYSWLVNDGTHLWTHTNILLSGPTAIEEETVASEVNVYPNPANENFTINITSETPIENADFILTDISGREVMRNKINTNTVQLQTEGLANGVYFYRAENAGVLLGNGKLVVEN